MHLADTLILMYNADTERFQMFIVNIFNMVLVNALMPHTHALVQLEPNIFLKVAAPIWSQVGISRYV